MSNHLAIAAVTTSLQQMLGYAVAAVPGARVTVRPVVGQDAGQEDRINLALVDVARSPHHAQAELPKRRADGSLVRVPSVPLELTYLISFHGANETLVPERLLGSTVALFAANPVLPPDFVAASQRAALPASLRLALEQADLADERPAIGLTLFPFDQQEHHLMWGRLVGQAPYQLSLFVQASAVRVSPDIAEPEPSRPVLPGGVSLGYNPPRIVDVTAAVTTLQPLQITCQGDLGGIENLVFGDGHRMAPGPMSRAGVFQVSHGALAQAGLLAGPNQVRLESSRREALLSEDAWFVLRPEVVEVQVQGQQVDFTIAPPPDADHSVRVVVYPESEGMVGLQRPVAVPGARPGAFQITLSARLPSQSELGEPRASEGPVASLEVWVGRVASPRFSLWAQP